MSTETDQPVADGGWTRVRADELLALHRVAQQAREAVELAAAAGVNLGPLRAALAETAYALPDFGKSGLTGAEAVDRARVTGKVTEDRYGVLHDGKAG